jgi:hypothetical protein
MKLSEVKEVLQTLIAINFQLPNKEFVSDHFHVTEVGLITKNFIDCGGTVRNEKVVNFQLWEANDVDHRLAPKKLMDIITLSEKVLGIEDLEVEVEYQGETIGKFGIEFDGMYFQLTQKMTNCLAQDKCGIPESQLKPKLSLAELQNSKNSCAPGGKCC